MDDEELCRTLMADRDVAIVAARFKAAFPLRYPETPHDFAWLAVDASAAVRMGVRDGLVDSGCLDPTAPFFEAWVDAYELALSGDPE